MFRGEFIGMYIKIEGAQLQDFAGKEIILFGAASTGVKALEEFENIQAKILGFCDNGESKWGTTFKGYPIYSPDELLRLIDKNPELITIVTSTYEDEIVKQLTEMKIKRVFIAKMGVLHDKIPIEAFANPVLDKKTANELLKKKLLAESPFFVGRVGSTELETICNYLYFTKRAQGCDIPYTKNITQMLCDWCGFFPAEHTLMDKFCKLYLEKIQDADLLWFMWKSRFEDKLFKEYCPKTALTQYEDTGFPIDIEKPWTFSLRGKKVLVIHPFEKSIQTNYKKRKVFFKNPEFLPEFDLITLKAVQTLADNKVVSYHNWFEALESMKKQMNGIDFDIALIGAGAYGFPLAAYAKELGKKALHIGGMLQLYFGIRGKYYDQFRYHNKYWTRPLDEEKPQGFRKVEAGRYW